MEISLFVDWRSVTHALRPQILPIAWAFDAEILAGILSSLRSNIDRLLDDRDVIVDTYLYGGFTDESGRDSAEFVALTEALSRFSWSGRGSNPKVRYRDLVTVLSVLPADAGTRLHALFRSRIRVPNPHLRVRGSTCSCSWMLLAQQVLSRESTGSELRCPECGTTRIEIESRGQKLVDTLIAAHVVHRAAVLLRSGGAGEIWVLSDDADALPAICTAAWMGIGASWLRSRPIRKYGYHDLALSHGIAIREVNRA